MNWIKYDGTIPDPSGTYWVHVECPVFDEDGSIDYVKSAVQAGTPLHVLQELGGWQSYEMVRKYAHLSAGQLADHARAIEGSRTFYGTPQKRKAGKDA